MILDQYNPINKQNLGWAVATLISMQSYPRLGQAMAKSGMYLGFAPFQATWTAGKIFVTELMKPKGSVAPLVSKRTLQTVGTKAAPAVRFVATVARGGTGLAGLAVTVGSAAATYGMAKQNPPLLNTDYVTGGPM